MSWLSTGLHCPQFTAVDDSGTERLPLRRVEVRKKPIAHEPLHRLPKRHRETMSERNAMITGLFPHRTVDSTASKNAHERIFQITNTQSPMPTGAPALDILSSHSLLSPHKQTANKLANQLQELEEIKNVLEQAAPAIAGCGGAWSGIGVKFLQGLSIATFGLEVYLSVEAAREDNYSTASLGGVVTVLLGGLTGYLTSKHNEYAELQNSKTQLSARDIEDTRKLLALIRTWQALKEPAEDADRATLKTSCFQAFQDTDESVFNATPIDRETWGSEILASLPEDDSDKIAFMNAYRRAADNLELPDSGPSSSISLEEKIGGAHHALEYFVYQGVAFNSRGAKIPLAS